MNAYEREISRSNAIEFWVERATCLQTLWQSKVPNGITRSAVQSGGKLSPGADSTYFRQAKLPFNKIYPCASVFIRG